MIGDSNVARSWQSAQAVRRDLVGVPLRSVSCFDTMEAALAEVTAELDYVVMSFDTSLVLDEASPVDVRGSCQNVFESVIKHLVAAAKKSVSVEVRFCLSPLIRLLYLSPCYIYRIFVLVFCPSVVLYCNPVV